ncbi:hypothetical protein EBU99_13130, partial [bacterium]|nr:hypothetical protein [bacterium]
NESKQDALEVKSREYRASMRFQNESQARLNRTLLEVVDKSFQEAEEILKHEFLCLNALEIEKQDAARLRWKTAMHQMQKLLQTAEENFSHVESHARDVDGFAQRKSATTQVRI